MKRFEGIIPPLTTPFTTKGELYEEGLRRLLDFQLNAGTQGLFVCGTYGSGPLMTLLQREKTAALIIDHVGSKMTTLIHTGAESTEEVTQLAKHAEAIGASAVSTVAPYYYRHDEATVLAFMETLVDSVSIPVFFYNNPSTSGFTLTPSFLTKLASAGVCGIKDSSFSFIDYTHFIIATKDYPDFELIIGTEALILPCMMQGAKACVSGLANVFPEIMADMYKLIQTKQYEKAASLQLRINEIRQILHIPASSTAACYTLLKHRGIDVGVPRAPIRLPTKEEEQKMIAEMERLNALKGALLAD